MAPSKAKPKLPAKPTAAQKKAAEALSLSPKEQAERWSTHSGNSERLVATHAALDKLVRKRFKKAEDVFDYNMRGWAIRRPTTIEDWTGTVDPNFIRIYLAERKAGITIHVWNPYAWGSVDRDELKDVGFKPMKGCLQYNRKGGVPVEALEPLLDEIAQAMANEA